MEVPVSISLYASDLTFRNYKNGIFNNFNCATTVNHAVNIVGWGNDNLSNVDYFIVRNSWGASWGDQGYIKVALSNNPLGTCRMFSKPFFYVRFI